MHSDLFYSAADWNYFKVFFPEMKRIIKDNKTTNDHYSLTFPCFSDEMFKYPDGINFSHFALFSSLSSSSPKWIE